MWLQVMCETCSCLHHSNKIEFPVPQQIGPQLAAPIQRPACEPLGIWPAQVRNYVLHPYKMVKDLRTGVETGNAAAVLDGDLDAFMQAFLRHKGSGPPAG